MLHPAWLPNGVVVGCAPETQRDSCDKLDKLAAKLYKLAEVAAESIAVKNIAVNTCHLKTMLFLGSDANKMKIHR